MNFNRRWGYLSRAGLNDKSQLCRQVGRGGVTDDDVLVVDVLAGGACLGRAVDQRMRPRGISD